MDDFWEDACMIGMMMTTMPMATMLRLLVQDVWEHACVSLNVPVCRDDPLVI